MADQENAPNQSCGNPLVIGAAERAALQTLARRAARMPLDLHRMVDDVQHPNGLMHYAAYLAEQSLRLPVDYSVFYSVEVGHPAGAMRHLSVNTAPGLALPNPSVAWTIAVELGFSGGVESCMTWMKEADPAGARRDSHGPVAMAIHLVQPVALGQPLPAVWLMSGGTMH